MTLLQSGTRPPRGTQLAAMILLAAVGVLYHDVLFLGRSVIPSNFHNPIDSRRTSENYGPEMVPLSEWTDRNLVPYPNLRDPEATWWQWEPGIAFLEQGLAAREWPFWDPYIAAGTPAMANLVPAFFFPPYLLVVMLGASPGMLNAYFLMLLWAAALLSFMFLRDHDLDFIPSLTGAVAVLVGGAMVQHAGTFIGQTAACMPLTMFATRRLLDSPTMRRMASLALCYACTALASFPPVLVPIFGIAASYLLVGTFEQAPGRRLRTIMLWMTGVVLALGLVAFYYLPALAAKAASLQVVARYQSAGLETMPMVHLYQLLSPTLMGGIRTYAEAPIAIQGPFVPFVGLVTLGLAMLASTTAAHARRRTLCVACSVVAAVILLKLIGAPVVQWVGALPMLREIHIADYFGIPLGFALAFLAALGMQQFSDGAVSRVRAVITAVVLIVLVESVWRVAAGQGVFESPAAGDWLRDWWVLALVAIVTSVIVALTSVLDGVRWRLAGSIALLMLLAIENGYNGWYPNPAAWDVFGDPPDYIEALQESGDDRTLAFGSFNANLNSPFGIFGLDSLMAFNPPRIYALYHRYVKPSPDVFLRGATSIPPEPLLDRANVGLLSINRFVPDVQPEAAARGYRELYNDGLIAVFRRPTLPRFRFTSAYEVMSAPDALEAISHLDANIVILEQEPDFATSENRLEQVAVQVTSYRRNSVILSVNAPRKGLVYAAESYFDGWAATVNANPVPILPANYAFRGIVVGPGQNSIEFSYWPPGLTAGLWITAGSVLMLVGAAQSSGRPTCQANTDEARSMKSA